jgi:hypothetical protein
MKAEDIIGTWRTTGHEIVAKDGSVSHPFGPGPHAGQLVYHPNGTVSVLVIRTDPQKLGAAAAASERAAALDKCVAYVGRYEVKGDRIVHKVDVSLNPAWVGTSQERSATLEGDRLVLSPPADAAGARARITWQRVSHAS